MWGGRPTLPALPAYYVLKLKALVGTLFWTQIQHQIAAYFYVSCELKRVTVD